MYDRFTEANLDAFDALHGVFLDAVIWCLGPVVDETKDYGLARRCLAVATCSLCRCVLDVED
jgi:hypothetical protein